MNTPCIPLTKSAVKDLLSGLAFAAGVLIGISMLITSIDTIFDLSALRMNPELMEKAIKDLCLLSITWLTLSPASALYDAVCYSTAHKIFIGTPTRTRVAWGGLLAVHIGISAWLTFVSCSALIIGEWYGYEKYLGTGYGLVCLCTVAVVPVLILRFAWTGAFIFWISTIGALEVTCNRLSRSKYDWVLNIPRVLGLLAVVLFISTTLMRAIWFGIASLFVAVAYAYLAQGYYFGRLTSDCEHTSWDSAEPVASEASYASSAFSRDLHRGELPSLFYLRAVPLFWSVFLALGLPCLIGWVAVELINVLGSRSFSALVD